MTEEVDFREQLANFVNALINLAPSRNYVAQFLYVIRMNERIDYRVLEDSYPEILKDEFVRKTFSTLFGVVFSDKVSLQHNFFGIILTDFISRIFQLFEDQEFRSRISMLIKDKLPEGLPNLVEEWLKVRVVGLSSVKPHGKEAVKVLRELSTVGRARAEELEKRLNMSMGDLVECLDLLSVYGLVVRDFDGSYRPSDDLRKYPRVLEGISV